MTQCLKARYHVFGSSPTAFPRLTVPATAVHPLPLHCKPHELQHRAASTDISTMDVHRSYCRFCQVAVFLQSLVQSLHASLYNFALALFQVTTCCFLNKYTKNLDTGSTRYLSGGDAPVPLGLLPQATQGSGHSCPITRMPVAPVCRVEGSLQLSLSIWAYGHPTTVNTTADAIWKCSNKRWYTASC
jgi:hypothetical protein